MNLVDATDFFCTSFSFIRSLAYPYECARVGDLRVLRDAVPKKAPRTQEIVIQGVPPEEALRQVAEYDPPRHFLCVVAGFDEFESVKAAYKAGGYRYHGIEDFFIRDLSEPIDDPKIDVRRVTTIEDADKVKRAARTTQLPVKYLNRGEIRLYAAWDRGQPVGWVRSIHVRPETAWTSNLFVPAPHRRRGIGTALMNAMLQDDRKHGALHNVLFASRAGSTVYPQLGYVRVALVMIFSKK